MLRPLPLCCQQVSRGGEVHALTPLAAANPLIHAFDGPAMFLNALWMPYQRDEETLKAALAAATAEAAATAAASGIGGGGAQLQAVFAHTDIVSGCCVWGLLAAFPCGSLPACPLPPVCLLHHSCCSLILNPLLVAERSHDDCDLLSTPWPAPRRLPTRHPHLHRPLPQPTHRGRHTYHLCWLALPRCLAAAVWLPLSACRSLCAELSTYCHCRYC